MRSPSGAWWGLGAVVVVLGCGSAEDGKRLEQAERAVRSALESWKTTASESSKIDGNVAVRLHDDDRDLGAALLEFEITRTYFDPDQTARCAVSLKLKRKGQSAESTSVVYQVVEKQGEVVIARDPFS